MRNTIAFYRQSGAELLRYGVVGIATNIVGYLVYLLVTYAGGTPKLTMSVLYIVGAALGFVGNRWWTFSHEGHVLRAGVRYIIAHCFGYLINLALLLTLVDYLGYPHQWVQGLAIVVVAFYLFLAFKFFVFPDNLPSRKARR